MSSSASSVLRWALPLSSAVVIAIGGVLAAAGESTAGILVAAIGAFDLVTAPLVLRMLGARRERRPVASIEAEPPVRGASDAPIDPAADPSYNPYARED